MNPRVNSRANGGRNGVEVVEGWRSEGTKEAKVASVDPRENSGANGRSRGRGGANVEPSSELED